MSLAIGAKQSAIGIDHGQRVEEGVVDPFEKTDRQHHLELRRHLLEAADSRAFLKRRRPRKMAGIGVLVEIGGFKELLQKYQIGAPPSRLSDQGFRPRQIIGVVLTAGHLRSCYNDYAHLKPS